MTRAALFVLLLAALTLPACNRNPPAPPPRAAPGSVATMNATTLAAYAAEGQKLWAKKACNACHSLDGTRSIGATAAGMWGRTLKLKDQREVTVDEAFIRQSVFDPSAAITDGYPNQMPNYTNRITDDELTAIAALYRSLQDRSPNPPPAR